MAINRIYIQMIAVLLTCFLYYESAFGQSLPAKIDEYVKERGKRSEFSGVILVAREGKIVFSKSYGMADYEQSISNTRHTRFRIGSLTKPFTAIAIMKLLEQGKLKLQDSISRYIKDCPTEWANITIHHLLTHTSGLPNLFGDMEAVPVEQTAAEIERVVATSKNKPLKTKPGEVYEYSNFGYCVLGYVIEKISGELYAPFLETNIFLPLKMAGTLYDDPRPIIRDRASGYIRKDGKIINDKPKDPAGYSAGGLLSTVEDFLLLDRALYSNELLSKESLNQMFTAFKNEYGYGWKVTNQFNRRVFNHNGGTQGFSSHIARYPDEKLLIVVLSNIENDRPQGIACNIAEIIFGMDYVNPTKSVRLINETLNKYIGDYRISPETVRAIKLIGERLVYQVGNNGYELIPLAEGVFYLEVQEETRLKFIANKDGQVIEVVRTTCGKEEFRATKN